MSKSNIKEYWKPVARFKGYYEVSNYGRVRSIDRYNTNNKGIRRKLQGRILSGCEHYISGHIYVTLCHDGNKIKKGVHALVLEAWVGLKPKNKECRHLDGRPDNNTLSNLKWGTRGENVKDQVTHGVHYSRYSRKQVLRSDGVKFNSATEAAILSGCYQQNISTVCRGIYKTAGGFGWKFT